MGDHEASCHITWEVLAVILCQVIRKLFVCQGLPRGEHIAAFIFHPLPLYLYTPLPHFIFSPTQRAPKQLYTPRELLHSALIGKRSPWLGIETVSSSAEECRSH